MGMPTEAPVVLGSVFDHGGTPRFYKQDQVRGRPEGGVGDQHQVEEKVCKNDMQVGNAAPGTCSVCVHALGYGIHFGWVQYVWDAAYAQLLCITL